MSGPDLNGKFSICRIEPGAEDPFAVIYITVKWGYDSEERAIAALNKVAQEESIPLADLAVVGTVFAADLARD